MVELLVAAILGWILLYLTVYTASQAWYSAAARFSREDRMQQLRELKERISRIQGELKEVLKEKPPTVH